LVMEVSVSCPSRVKAGGAPHILAWFARSLACLGYNYQRHPLFYDNA